MIMCSGCGAAADEPPATWSWQTQPGRPAQWRCENCTRDALRAIEGRLDAEVGW